MTAPARLAPAARSSVAERVEALDWRRIAADLDEHGYATTGPLLDPEECAGIRALYPEDAPFRGRIVMARHGFGRGEYRYFAYPLPDAVAELRRSVYPHLAPVANAWAEALGEAARYPDALDPFLARCREAGQARPTPLLLKYGPGDHNRLHRDLYGDLAFPLQLAVLLSGPGEDFAGGEFVLVESRPRTQSAAEVVPLGRGEGVIFAVNTRPVLGTRGVYRAALRHGVSRVRSGERFTLGVIFHDAA